MRVSSIRYRVVTRPDTDFDGAKRLDVDWPDFAGHLESGILTLRPKDRIEAIEVARALAEPWLRTWEIEAGLRYQSPDEFLFTFVDAEVEDDSRPGVMVIRDMATFSVHASGHASRMLYPAPPASGNAPPEAEAIWARLGRYLSNRDTLQSVAYFAFTLLKRDGESKADATKRHGIPSSVLDNISRLSSTRGDVFTARKANATAKPLTPGEESWLRQVLFAIVGHLLSLARDPSHKWKFDVPDP